MTIPFALLYLFLVFRTGFKRERTLGRQTLRLLGTALMLLGSIAFFAPSFSSGGYLGWLPKDLEWPIRSSKNVLVLDDGTTVVPHSPSNRIQIYDADLTYLRGWSIKAGGGSMRIVPASNETFFVYTARGNHKREYDSSGTLISASTYSHKDEPFDELPAASGLIEFERPLYLFPLTHPFAAFPFLIFGLLLTNRLEERDPRKPTGNPKVYQWLMKRLMK